MSGDRNVAEGWGRALTAVTRLSCSLCLIDELHLLADRGQLNLARHSADRFTSFLDMCATLARATLPELRKYTHPLLTLCYRPWKYQAQVPKEHQQPRVPFPSPTQSQETQRRHPDPSHEHYHHQVVPGRRVICLPHTSSSAHRHPFHGHHIRQTLTTPQNHSGIALVLEYPNPGFFSSSRASTCARFRSSLVQLWVLSGAVGRAAATAWA